MLGIMKKDLIYTAGYLIAFPLMLLYLLASRESLDSTAVFLLAGWMYIVTLGSVLVVEANEMKNRGYSFLSTIPVRPAEIAAGKLLPVFLQVIIYTFAGYLALSTFDVSPGQLETARRWILFNSLVVAFTVSAVYWLMFRVGFERAVWLNGFLLMAGFIQPIVLNEMTVRGHIGESFVLFRIAGSLNVPFALAALAALFFAAWRFSARALKGEIRG